MELQRKSLKYFTYNAIVCLRATPCLRFFPEVAIRAGIF
jgi:hypothetical protein